MPGDKQRSGLHPGGRKSQARKEAMGLEVKEEGYRRVGVVAAGGLKVGVLKGSQKLVGAEED